MAAAPHIGLANTHPVIPDQLALGAPTHMPTLMLATSPKTPGKPRRAFIDAALALDKISQRLGAGRLLRLHPVSGMRLAATTDRPGE